MQIMRFALVGVTVALVYISLYVGLLALGIPQVISNALAFMIAIGVQYIGQGRFTFGQKLKDRDQATRFIVMVGLGLLTASIITGLLAPAIELDDWIAAAIVTVVLPIQNYLFMAGWVFKKPTGAAKVSS